MTWTSPRTWTAGEVVTAAIGNTHWRDDLNYLYGGSAGRKPTFNLYGHSLAFSVANGSETTVTSGLTVGEDTDSGLTAATCTYAIQTSGMWLLRAEVQWATNTTGGRAIHLAGVPTTAPWFGMTANTDPTSHGTTIAVYLDRLNVGTSVQANVYQSSGGALNLTDFGFMGTWLGA